MNCQHCNAKITSERKGYTNLIVNGIYHRAIHIDCVPADAATEDDSDRAQMLADMDRRLMSEPVDYQMERRGALIY